MKKVGRGANKRQTKEGRHSHPCGTAETLAPLPQGRRGPKDGGSAVTQFSLS